MKKLLAILPLVLAGCAQPQPTAPTKTIGMPNPAAVYCQQSGGTGCRCKRRRASAPSANYPAAKPSTSGRCGAGIIRLNRNRQGRQPGGQHPGMILLGVLRSVQQRQRLALRQRRQPQARFAMGVELLTIALAEVGEIDRLAVKVFAQLSGRR